MQGGSTTTTQTKVTIKPRGDRVVIRPAQREEVSAGAEAHYATYAGTEIKIEGENLLIASEGVQRREQPA